MELVISLLVGVLLVELYSWLPMISAWLLELAIQHLPAEIQERFREEWQAHLNDFPNSLMKMTHALSYMTAIIRINSEYCETKFCEINCIFVALSRKHNANLIAFRAVQSNAAETQGLIRKLEGVVEQSTVRGTEPIRKLGHAYIDAFSRSHGLVIEMIDNASTKVNQVDKEIQVMHRKYREVVQLFRKHKLSVEDVILELRNLETDLDELQMAVENETECERNDQLIKQFNQIIAAVRQVRNNLSTRLSAATHDT